jgi:CRISPR locus-related DNA-binding protein
MPKLFVIPVGFQAEYHIRALIDVQAKPSDLDVILALMPAETSEEARDRTQKAFETLRGIFKVKVNSLVVNISKPEDAIPQIISSVLKLVREVNADEVVFMVSGGVRAIGMYMLMANLLLNKVSLKSRFYVIAENLNTLIELTDLLKPISTVDLSETKLMLLKELEGGGCLKASDLSDRVNLDSSTINRHLSDLEDNGLVKRGSRGRCYGITRLGLMLLRAYLELRKSS